MKEIFMRSAMPFEGIDNISKILINNNIGENTGNLLFQNSVARTIMQSDTNIKTFYSKRVFSDKEIDEINQKYDAIILPLANAFRSDFMFELECLTNLVKKATIPCVVVGVGMQKRLNSNEWDFPYDEKTIEFVKAVLEKSDCIGVRGEITAEYLKRKGFIPEKHFTVIGCPSMYTYGDNLPVPEIKPLTYDSKATMVYRNDSARRVVDYLSKEASKFSDLVTITQRTHEIKGLYIGLPYPEKQTSRPDFPSDYPIHNNDERMTSRRYVGFLDEASWVDFARGREFSFGSRIHGMAANILAGVPSYIISDDARVVELAAYHHIPHTTIFDLDDDTDILTYYEKADYSALHAGHEDRVTHYLDFLKRNHIDTISRDVLNSDNAPFDVFEKTRPRLGPIYATTSVDIIENERRLNEYVTVFRSEVNSLKKEKTKLEKKNNDYQNNINSLKKEKTQLEKKNKEVSKKLEKTEKTLKEIKSRKIYRLLTKFDALVRLTRRKKPKKKDAAAKNPDTENKKQ